MLFTRPQTRPTIETDRLLLQPIGPFALACRTYHWTKHPELFLYIGMRTSGWTFRRYYRDLRARARRSKGEMRSIIEKATGKLVGLHLIHVSSGTASTTIIIGKDHWGSGFHQEIGPVIMDHCFHVLNVVKISNSVAAGNTRSAANMERFGYLLEGRLRLEFPLRDGTLDDKLVYGITRADWETLQHKTGRQAS